MNVEDRLLGDELFSDSDKVRALAMECARKVVELKSELSKSVSLLLMLYERDEIPQYMTETVNTVLAGLDVCEDSKPNWTNFYKKYEATA